jgi:inosine-uridine nucleoside N-ribohydrolase
MNRMRRLLGGLLAVALSGFLPAIAGCGGAAVTARGPAPVIVDTDMGSDDIMALAYLLKRPGLDIRAVTVEGTGLAHGPAGARNALRLIRALDIHRTIPIGYGPPQPLAGFRSFPLGWRTTADNMYGLGLPAWAGPAPAMSAVRLLADTIKNSPRPVDVITLGPFTNLAFALRADPAIGRRIAMVYSMAGAVRVDGNEPFHRRAEWNVYVDATAARRVLRSGVPMTFIPLDASDNVPITSFFRDAVQAHPRTAALRLIAAMLRDPYYLQGPTYFWDPLAAVAATDHWIARLRAERLVIGNSQGPDLGVTRVGSAGTSVRVAVSADAAAFQRRFLATLNDGRPVPVPAVPASHRLAVTFDGNTYRYQGPRTAAAGQLGVQLADRSPVPFDGFALVVGRLASGWSLADVRAVIRRGTATKVPAWFTVTAILPAAPATQPAWGVSLRPGRYALVCTRARDSALYALGEITIR